MILQHQIPVIRWRIPAKGCGWPLFRKNLAGIWVSQRIPAAGRKSFQPVRYLFLYGWKEILPAGEVLVPRRPEGCPSSQQGTCTSPAGRVSFQLTRYLYLDGWKEALPVDKVQVPRLLEGHYMYLAGWKENLPAVEVQVP
jgi:hypothetical protein